MFPKDSEFTILYIAYFIMLIFLVIGILKSKKKSFYKLNFVIFDIYSIIMIWIFLEPENFKYGSSLYVLFLGGLFIVLHFLIIGFINLIHLLKPKN